MQSGVVIGIVHIDDFEFVLLNLRRYRGVLISMKKAMLVYDAQNCEHCNVSFTLGESSCHSVKSNT